MREEYITLIKIGGECDALRKELYGGGKYCNATLHRMKYALDGHKLIVKSDYSK